MKNYSYAIVDGQVYYRENSRMVRPDLNATAEALSLIHISCAVLTTTPESRSV